MIVDCHAHLDERVFDVPGLVRHMDAAGVDRAVLLGRITETAEPAKSQALLAIQRTLMCRAWGRPVAEAASKTFYDRAGRLRPVWRPFTHGGTGYVKTLVPDNASVALAVRSRPDRFWGWVFVNPAQSGDAVGELERWRAEPGMVGVKAHPYWHGYAVRALGPVARRAEELGLPMLVHLGFRQEGDYGWLLDHHPRLRVIFAHGGIPFFTRLWRDLSRWPNARVDLSSTEHLSEYLVRRIVSRLGASRCVFGTDSPYGGRAPDGTYPYGRIREWIDRLPIPADERTGILGRNFLELLRV